MRVPNPSGLANLAMLVFIGRSAIAIFADNDIDVDGLLEAFADWLIVLMIWNIWLLLFRKSK